MKKRRSLKEEEKQLLDKVYLYYKSYNLSLNNLESFTEIDRTTIGKYYKKKFGEEYIVLAKLKNKIKPKHSEETKIKLSLKLKGKKKPPRSEEHRKNLSLAFKGRSFEERFGEKAEEVKNKISNGNKGKKRNFKNKDIWKANLSNSLKGRNVWNKGKKGLKTWNKSILPEKDIIDSYQNSNKSSKNLALIYNVSKDVILRILKENNIKRKTSKEFLGGKSLVELYGGEKADEIKKKLSEKFKGREITWRDKMVEGLRNYHENHEVSDERRQKQSEISRKMWQNKEYREKLINVHKERLRNNPTELERLKNMQPNKITKIESKMLEFLKSHFVEDKDFYFDQQDLTDKTLYRPDFQFPKHKVIIELYGYYKHFTDKGKQKDKIREYYLKKAGWTVYKFNFLEIERNYLFNKTKEKVLNILKNGKNNLWH